MCFKDWVDEFEMFTICMLPRLDPDDTEGDEMAEQWVEDFLLLMLTRLETPVINHFASDSDWIQ